MSANKYKLVPAHMSKTIKSSIKNTDLYIETKRYQTPSSRSLKKSIR